MRLSGGQAQRVCIARALYHDPPVLLFDEATSALDTESEATVKRNLDRVLEQRTAVIVAHRLTTIRDADTIAVLEQGRLVEHGTHDELTRPGRALPPPPGEPDRMRLGVLDLGRELEGSDSAERVQQTIELARLAEENGFSRYWVAEHHVEGTTLAAPEVILGVVAASTMTIRVGSGGVLLRYYSPLKVAEVYLTLAAAFPGRVELGVCRGPGVPDERTALALVSDNVAELTDENYALKLDELFAFLDRNGSSRIPRARPRDVATPPVWVLGSGSRSVEQAVQHRSRYGFMCFFPGSEQLGPQLVGQYLADVRAPEDEGPLIAVTVVCAETDKKARRLHDSLLASGYLASNVVGDRRHCVRRLRKWPPPSGRRMCSSRALPRVSPINATSSAS